MRQKEGGTNMKKSLLCLSALMALSLLSCASQGSKGEKGDKGDIGETGLPGKDGSKIYTGEGLPDASLGAEGDVYINTSAWEVYVKGSSWESKGNIKGDKGVSIVNAYIDDEGYLVCELSDGSYVKAGKVKDTSLCTVNFHFKDSLIETREVASGSKLTPPKDSLIPEGYAIDGWHVEEYGFSSSWTYSGCTVTSDLDLYADYHCIPYKIAYDLDGGINHADNPNEYTVEDSLTLKSPSKKGYSFLGWTGSNGDTPELACAIEQGSLGDKTYVAHWEAAEQELELLSNDSSLGSVALVSGTGYTGTSMTVKATSTEEGLFMGWYCLDELVSKEETYSFAMPNESTVLTAYFADKKELGMAPVYDPSSKTITYGLYPQSHVSDLSLISRLDSLEEGKGETWYSYKDSYYVKAEANPYNTDYLFEDDTSIVTGESYWFKCEKISWNVLESSSSDGSTSYKLLSSRLLDIQTYYSSEEERVIDGTTIYANNYAYSDIRNWLNGDFLNSAFALSFAFITETVVDNSESTTRYSPNKYACGNTKDKIYLPSFSEMQNTSYGFTDSLDDDEARTSKTTDYTRAKGSFISEAGCGDYWLRSPSTWRNYALCAVSAGGGLHLRDMPPTQPHFNVRPCIGIKIE